MSWGCEGKKMKMGCSCRSRGWWTSPRSKAATFLDTHFDWWVSRWPLHSDLKWLRVVPHLQEHLPINCVFVNIKRFLLVFLSILHVLFLWNSFWQFWEICSFKMAGQTEVPFPPPCWTLDVIRGQGLWLHYWKTPWPLVCIFLPECVCADVWVYVGLCIPGCVSVSCCTQIYCTKQLPLFATMEN